jgi:chitin disaccharide deacetylase
VSVEFLQRLLRDEVGAGWTELSCHPGYVSSEVRTVYSEEREAEVRTLTDPRVRQTIGELGIRLVSFADLPRSSGESGPPPLPAEESRPRRL